MEPLKNTVLAQGHNDSSLGGAGIKPPTLRSVDDLLNRLSLSHFLHFMNFCLTDFM